MAKPDGYLIPGDYVDSFFDVCERHRKNNYGTGHGQVAGEELAVARRSVGESVMLLENLRANRVAYAEKLEIDTDSFIVDIVVIGWPEAAVETVEVQIGSLSSAGGGPTNTYKIPLNATAKEFADITKVTGEVSLGAKTVTNDEGKEVLLVPARWRVRWNQASEVPLIGAGTPGQSYMVRVEQTLLWGTGETVKVIQTLPTGWDTPLRAGAICETIRGRGGYYKVIGAEARFWYGTEIVSGAT